MKPHQPTLVTCLLVLYAAFLALIPTHAASPPNAWQIADASTVGGSLMHYQTTLTPAQQSAATNNGWRMVVIARLVEGSGGGSPAHSMFYGNGTRRFAASWDINAGGLLTVTLDPALNPTTFILTATPQAATNYHRHELVYDATSDQGSYLFDGTVIRTWIGEALNAQNGTPQWGSSSSAGDGRMNYHSVQFTVEGQGLLADYFAGYQGDPAVAPNPVSQGWTLVSPTGGVVTSGPVSPDLGPLPAGTLDRSFSPNIGGTVETLAPLPDGRLLAAGDFTAIGGVSHMGVARLNADGSPDSAFTTMVTEFPGALRVSSLAVQADQRILLGGVFSTINGQGYTNLARLSGDGTIDSAFRPAVLPHVSVLGLRCVAIQTDGRALIGGLFTNINGVARSRLARINTDGSLDLTFNPAPNEGVTSLAVQPDGRILVGGFFNNVAGQTRNRIARLLPDGSLDSTFNPGANDQVTTLAVQSDGLILMGGSFTNVAGVRRNRCARLNANGTLDLSFDPDMDIVVSGLTVQTDGRIVVTGGFTTVGGAPHKNVTRLLASGVVDPTFAPDIVSPTFLSVRSAAIQADGEIVFGGSFTQVAGLNRDLARLRNGPVTNVLTAPTASRVQWLRGGNGPEVIHVGFDLSTDGGTSWTPLGALGTATRITGGWQLSGLSLPSSGLLRARGRVPVLGHSSGLIEQQASFGGGSNPNPIVTSTTDSGPGSLRQALADVSPNGTITFASTLSGGTIGLTSGELVIDKNLSMVGPGADQLTISGNQLSRVFSVNPGATSILAGLTITRGTGTGASGAGLGGGIYNRGFLTVTNCILNGNTAANFGGGICNSTGKLTVLNCTFSGNTSSLGGGILGDGVVVAVQSRFLTNSVGVNGLGGGICVNNAGSLTVENCTLSGNTANSGGLGNGGGIAVANSASLTVLDSTFSGNSANNGGGIHGGGGVKTIRNSTLVGNSALYGGGIYNLGANQLTIVNSTLSGNTSSAGGSGVYSLGLLTVQNTTVTGNRAGPAGTGIAALYAQDTCQLSHCLVAGNFIGSTTTPADIGGLEFSAAYNLIGSTGLGATNGNLVLNNSLPVTGILNTNLALNGGLTATHALPLGSPALNAGTNGAIAGLPYDQRGTGFPRLVGSAVDIGAYELQTSPVFAQVPIDGLQGVVDSTVTWADYDSDGRLDLFLTGGTGLQKLSQLWRNTGAGFSLVPIAGLAGISQGTVAWSDYDNDGRLDFLITGNAGPGNISQLWRNTGSGFVQVPIPGLPAVLGGVAWADYDGDGRQDFLITGNTGSASAGSTNIAQLWRNTGSGFVEVPVPGLPGSASGSVAWGDYDNDGRPDFLITGSAGNDSPVSQLWRNTGSGFARIALPGVPGVFVGTVAWGDYDNDGRLDFLLTGFGDSSVAQIWRNTGSGFANATPIGFPQVSEGAAAWGDYDNDGRLDILITGIGAGADLAQVWRNTGSTFTPVTDPTLARTSFGAVAWADYDNDGRLDVFQTGLTTGLWRNISPATNTVPSAPAGLASQVLSDSSVTLRWNPATDAQTPSAGLSYNLVLGTSANAVNAASPQASVPGGFRRVVRLGAVNGAAAGSLVYTFTNLPPAPQYFWSVQAIDTAFAGGPFAPAQSFLFSAPLQATVTNTNDSGPGSLRQAIANLSAGGTIDFAPGLIGGTIGLTSGELAIDKNLTILGPGANQLTISGNTNSRVFSIQPGVTCIFQGLTLARGFSPDSGGAILMDRAFVTLQDCVVSNNLSHRGGGICVLGASGLRDSAKLTVRNSTLNNNTAQDGPGGSIFISDATVEMVNSTISSSSANSGGGVLNNNGALSLRSCTVSGNSVVFSGGGIYNADGTLTLSRTLFAKGARGVNLLNDLGPVNNLGFNLSDDASLGTIATQVADLKIAPLANNGGPTPTHRLLLGSPAIDAGPGSLPNAWQISDASGVAGSLNFTNTLSSAQKLAATNSGWHFTVVSRLVAGSGGGSPAQFMTYGHGDRRFLVGWDLDALGRLTARFYGAGGNVNGIATNLTGPGEGLNAYHQHELVYSPVTRAATYLVDGTAVFTWSGLAPSPDYNGQAFFGAAAAGGRGGMNYHRVQFAITGHGAVSEYFAGYFGDPNTTPAPAAQGWTRTQTVPTNTDVTEAPISPDYAPLAPSLLDALGLLSDQRGPGFDRVAHGWIDIGAYEVQQPKVTQAGKVPEGFSLSFKGEANETLNIEWNADAKNTGWQPLATGTTDGTGSIQILDPAPNAPRRFYRSVRP